jgi:glycosyltransferase involved in cell wall biosynthesis
MTPRVSVVVATRDRRRLLARALATVDAQRYRDLEVIVVNDGSADDTAGWLRAERPRDCVVETGRPRGAAAARNRGVARARGEIVAFLDDDDAWRASYLKAQVARLDADPGLDLCTAGHVEVDAGGRVFHPDLRPVFAHGSALVHMLAECPIHTLSVVACRRATLARIGPFDETLQIAHDLDWYLRLLGAGGRVAHHQEALVERTVPGGLMTRHRQWFREERAVHRRMIDQGLVTAAQQRRIRAARALLFARIALAKGDVPFALARVVEAFAAAPLDATRIGGVRSGRSGRAWLRGARRPEGMAPTP